MTFSIVARHGDAYGVAVASKFLSVGAVVPGARSGVGAVATQSFARVAYIGDLLAALATGADAATALAAATAADDLRDERQVGVVGAHDAATFTGSGCTPWAGGTTGSGEGTAYAIQGNILAGPQVVRDMEQAWLGSVGQEFTTRLLLTLLAGDSAGGDARGRQSAAMYAVQPGSGYDACGVLADLRVDDHPDAPTEMARIHELHTLYFGRPEGVQPLAEELDAEVRRRLDGLGFTGGRTADDLARWAGAVNLEMRLSPDGIDRRVLVELRNATA